MVDTYDTFLTYTAPLRMTCPTQRLGPTTTFSTEPQTLEFSNPTQFDCKYRGNTNRKMPETKGGFARAAEPFVCGGSAATFASIIIHPMDLAKVRSFFVGLQGVHPRVEEYFCFPNSPPPSFGLLLLIRTRNHSLPTHDRCACNFMARSIRVSPSQAS